MNEQRNIVLAVVLSALVLIGWTYVSHRWIPTANPPATKIVNGKQQPLPKPQASPGAVSGPALQSAAAAIASTPRVAIETPRLRGSIALKGARIDDLVLLTHREGIAKDSPPIRLLAPAGTPHAYFASFGWTGDGIAAPGPDTVWTPSGARLAPGSPVRLSWTNPQGLRFDIGLAVDDGYMFTVEQRVSNGSGSAIATRPYSFISRAEASKDIDSWTNHTGPQGVFKDAANYDISFKNLDGQEPGFFSQMFGTKAKAGPNYFDTQGGWVGFSDKYWLTALIPDRDAPVHSGFQGGTGKPYQADYMLPPLIVAPGHSTTISSQFFAGAKEVQLLDRYQDAGVAKFDKAIDWGWFEWFMKPIFKLLNWLYAQIGNFGLAIICLTLIIRTLMFPIAQKQFKSMAAMRVLQPKMKALQDRHKEDKPRLQQEMLKLYQEEKVNPMAGCLPIVIQIPIFYALYKTLMVSVEMRHKPFALWIKDLSAPDPLTPVNLFGYLHFTPPPFLALGVLPILLGITMYMQFKLNPPPTDPVQKQVFGMMPWIMMFIFAPFAAGLQLYYVCNNLYGIIQQRWLYARYSPDSLKGAKPGKT